MQGHDRAVLDDDDDDEKTHLYVLEYEKRGAERTRFKIGITNRPGTGGRRRDHETSLDGWVRTVRYDTYVVPDGALSGGVERDTTEGYIATYGYDRVRGSAYDYPGKNKNHRMRAEAYRQLAAKMQRCYACLGTGHLADRCPDAQRRLTSRERFARDGVPGFDVPRPVPLGVRRATEARARARRRATYLRRLECTIPGVPGDTASVDGDGAPRRRSRRLRTPVCRGVVAAV